jgi:hypothetical protein
VFSGSATWWAWRGPPAETWPAPPPARPRPISQEEASELARLQDKFQQALSAAAMRNGAPLTLDQLEASDSQGNPWLTSGIPDNPLTDGVGWVAYWCQGDPTPATESGPDWLYCPSDGQVLANGGLGGGSLHNAKL